MDRRAALIPTAIAAAAVLATLSGCDRFVPDAGPLAASPVPTPPAARPFPNDPSRPLVGLYDLRLELGSGCEVVPASERTRDYAASIRVHEPTSQALVALDSGTFLTGPICTGGSGPFAGVGCHQFFVVDDIDRAYFTLGAEDDAHGGAIVERLASGSWLSIGGRAAGPTDPAGMSATGSASVWYCPTPAAYPFPCVTSAACTTDLRLTFRRK
jgi:hypothetical protein